MSFTLAVLETVLAQTPTPIPGNPVPVPGQGGTIGDINMVAPPGEDKYRQLAGIVLFIVALVLTGMTMFSGVKFAQAFMEGNPSVGQKMAPLGCAAGAIIAGTAGLIVTQFMGG
ncbi:hypothetical protein ACTD5D_40040 [Nocardia takedensis]|uniref:hypothetical protein n=1 Tax=Nocardia takedensis TaxID=259390 RepID=UPI003F7779FA